MILFCSKKKKPLSVCCLRPRRLGTFISGICSEVKRVRDNLTGLSLSSKHRREYSFQEVFLFSAEFLRGDLQPFFLLLAA